LNKVPKEVRTAVRHNAGGHVNHSLFWKAMSPSGGDAPAGALADAIVRDFGSVEQLKVRFAEAGQQRFGSGWVWLARTQLDGGRLQVISTFGHENPLLQGHYPILVNDVWEHAYYLKYENRRADYLKDWWAVANWEEAAQRYEGSDSARDDWEAEGGAQTEDRRKSDAGPSQMKKDGVQGEGNYEAAREFNEAERKFVASGKVAAAARAAAPKSEAERQEMIAAEEQGKRRAKQ
jgi:superoxide dismutase